MPRMISIPLVEQFRLEWIAARERRDRLRAEQAEADRVAAETFARWQQEQEYNEMEEEGEEDAV